MKNIFRGLGIALVTPFCEDGTVDYRALETLVEYQISNGADFLCILATTGETPTLTTEEKQRIRQTIIKVANSRVPILIGCGGNNTAAVCQELRNGDFIGIDGVLSVCPYYNKPTQEGLYQHFLAISMVSPLPVVLYNVPGRTGVNLLPETTLRLARDCENIVAVKEASGNIEQIKTILSNKPEDFDVLSGDDALTLDIIRHGGTGAISVIGNALVKETAAVIHHALEGDYAEAEKIDNTLTDLYRLIFVDGNPAGIKVILSEMGLIKNVLRLPLVPASAKTIAEITEKIQNVE